MPLLLAFLCCFAVARSADAQSDTAAPGPVVTDRPDKTESTSIVPRGCAQLEAGWSLETVRRDVRQPAGL
ncbi:MAG: hypothetical protein HYW06_09900 [Gemmatimonadetes bacterium]|nr:hypothetical protein [Gemmatimonadota bacterium]